MAGIFSNVRSWLDALFPTSSRTGLDVSCLILSPSACCPGLLQFLACLWLGFSIFNIFQLDVLDCFHYLYICNWSWLSWSAFICSNLRFWFSWFDFVSSFNSDFIFFIISISCFSASFIFALCSGVLTDIKQFKTFLLFHRFLLVSGSSFFTLYYYIALYISFVYKQWHKLTTSVKNYKNI